VKRERRGRNRADETGTVKPSANGANGDLRDEKGRFLPGNKGGPGNPYVRETARLRSLIHDAVSDEDLKAVIARLVETAKQGGRGSAAAARELLDRLLGKARQHIDLDAEIRAESAFELNLDAVPDDELDRVGHAIDAVVRRIDGRVYVLEDPEAALGLRGPFRLIQQIEQTGQTGGLADLPRPLAQEYLQRTVAALRTHLPELTSLLERAEAALRYLGAGRPDNRPALPDRAVGQTTQNAVEGGWL
jgi:hypothetical protein